MEQHWHLTTAGSHCQGQLRWLELAQDTQHLSARIHAHAQHAHSTYSLQSKRVLAGRAQSQITGCITVDPSAQDSAGEFYDHVLLLSPNARGQSEPQFAIEQPQVRCAHGATLGPLDPEQLWYAQTRGLSLPQAQYMLIQGFMADMWPNMPISLQPLIHRRLEQLNSACS